MQRWLLALAVATFLAALSAWAVVVAPAYWDRARSRPDEPSGSDWHRQAIRAETRHEGGA
jgi:hypothetical protein